MQVECERRRAAAAAVEGDLALDNRGAVNKFIQDCGGPIVAAQVRALCLLHAPTACVSQVILALNKTCELEHFNVVMLSQAGFIFSRNKYRMALVLVLACACLCVTLVVFVVGTLPESTRFHTRIIREHCRLFSQGIFIDRYSVLVSPMSHVCVRSSRGRFAC